MSAKESKNEKQEKTMGKIKKIPEIIQKHAMVQACHIMNMSDEDCASLLSEIIDAELDKPAKERDGELIEQCSVLLVELMPDDAVMTAEELEANLQTIKSSVEPKIIRVHTHKHLVWRRVAVAAAIAMVTTMLSLSVVAVQQGYSNAFEFVADKASQILCLNTGKQHEDSGFSVTLNGHIKEYADIEEFLQKENLHILYPSKLPEKLELNRVDFVSKESEVKKILFVFDNNQYSIRVCNLMSDLTQLSNCTIYESNGKEYYLTQHGNIHQAICQYKDFEHIISTPDYETLLFLINSLKETP